MPCGTAGKPSRYGSSSTTSVRIRIRRRGGLAGIPLCADVDTAELGSQSAARVEAAVSKLLATRGTVPPPHPDAFEYEIAVPDRDDSVLVGEDELPSDLEPLLSKLAKVGHLEPTRRRPR
jgi:hypothetical protein